MLHPSLTAKQIFDIDSLEAFPILKNGLCQHLFSNDWYYSLFIALWRKVSVFGSGIGFRFLNPREKWSGRVALASSCKRKMLLDLQI
jgi:hypothetical protein